MRKQITSLALLEQGAVIIGIRPNKKEHTFIVMGVWEESGENSIKLELMQINNEFKTWHISLPTGCNKEKQFISKNDASYNFEFFDTGKTAKELSIVLLEHIKAEQ
jgi:hypothetical protein